MTIAELEELLHEEEGNALDFKRDQYPFGRQSDEVKSELLKDILSFANAWRRNTAYILVGVEEVKAGRSVPVGVTEHFEDASLQQFVNSKTTRPLNFRYFPFSVDGCSIGVFEVPKQKRPLVLKKDYGKLAAGKVYLRRGSSTAVAGAEEIARMGEADSGLARGRPSLSFAFADLDTRDELGTVLDVASTVLDPRVDPDLLKPPKRTNPLGIGGLAYDVFKNDKFYEEFVEYIYRYGLLKPVGFVVHNNGDEPAKSVEIELRLPVADGMTVVSESGGPRMPRRNSSVLAGMWDSDVYASTYRRYHEITTGFDLVFPKGSAWSAGPFYVGSDRDQEVEGTVRVFAENLNQPEEFPVKIRLESRTEPMELEFLKELLRESE